MRQSNGWISVALELRFLSAQPASSLLNPRQAYSLGAADMRAGPRHSALARTRVTQSRSRCRSGDKERMRTMITWLGFRHVKYGVRPHHIPIMGQVLASPSATLAIASTRVHAAVTRH